MAAFDNAFGDGPEGPTYRPPVARNPTLLDRLRARLWHRWGVGERPLPRFEPPRPDAP